MDLLEPPIDRSGFEANMLRLCDQLGQKDDVQPESNSCRLVDAMRYIVGSGGKRFRGALCVAAYRFSKGSSAVGSSAVGSETPTVLAAAAAIEMIHAASLALDDLPCMDDADIRRGSPCVHRVHGEAASVLAASALVIRGIRTMLVGDGEAGLRMSNRVAVCAELMIASERMAMGQIRDLELSGRTDPPLAEHVRSAHAGKTGALIAAAATVGVLCAEGDASIAQKVLRFGTRLGLAYQIVDDIIDATATRLESGKPTGADRGVNSFVAVAGLAAAVEEARRLVREAVDAISPEESSHSGDLVRIAKSILGHVPGG